MVAFLTMAAIDPMKNHTVISGNETIEVAISPIPATTWVSVDYKLPEEATKATMTIINPLGIKLMEVRLDSNNGTKTIDLHNLSTGVYSYTVRCGEYNKIGKLIVIR